ncbi:MAG: hypothetical protein MHPSP_003930, partial [Paramarteilia canceri]
ILEELQKIFSSIDFSSFTDNQTDSIGQAGLMKSLECKLVDLTAIINLKFDDEIESKKNEFYRENQMLRFHLKEIDKNTDIFEQDQLNNKKMYLNQLIEQINAYKKYDQNKDLNNIGELEKQYQADLIELKELLITDYRRKLQEISGKDRIDLSSCEKTLTKESDKNIDSSLKNRIETTPKPPNEYTEQKIGTEKKTYLDFSVQADNFSSLSEDTLNDDVNNQELDSNNAIHFVGKILDNEPKIDNSIDLQEEINNLYSNNEAKHLDQSEMMTPVKVDPLSSLGIESIFSIVNSL